MAPGWEKSYSTSEVGDAPPEGEPREKASTLVGREFPRVPEAASALFRKGVEEASEANANASTPWGRLASTLEAKHAKKPAARVGSGAARGDGPPAATPKPEAAPEPSASSSTEDADPSASSSSRSQMITRPDASSPGAATVDASASASGSRRGPDRPRTSFDVDLSDSSEAERSGVHTRAPWIEAALRGNNSRHAAAVALVPGQLLTGTRYRILRWLGDGGMGVVYEAEHVDLERRVALKILRAEVCNEPRALKAFRDEARAVGKIGAAQIVDIFDFAELADGRLMFAMEMIEGAPLFRMYEQALLSPARVIAILRQICKGLAAAHEAGVIHRDIKPDNILVGTRSGRADSVKILDFGIATILAEQRDEDSGVAGTPFYLAPEIVSGLKFDRRVDVYALGCTAYEMLVGEPPFFHEGIEKALRAHLVEQPRRPSAAIGSSVPSALEDVVLRCLEKLPDNRYPDMVALEAALCRAQLAAGIITEWDDLPLPDIEPDARAELLAGYAELASVQAPARRGRALLWGGLAAAVGLAAALFVFMRPGASDDELAAIEALVERAREAASRASFVYPPRGQPKAPTAYSTIAELEALRPEVGRAATRRGGELRDEFASTLVRLGDEYWEKPGGKGFAIDYYAQALVFDDDNAKANERVTYTPGQLAVLRDKVERHDFTDRDLFIAETLEALAMQDPEERARKLAALQEDETRAVSTQETLAELLESDPVTVKVAKATRPKPSPRDPDERAPAVEDVIPDLPGEPVPDLPPEDLTPEPAAPPSTKEIERQAQGALKAGRTDEAERLFKRAVALNSRSPAALIGLSDVAFDRGDYDEAAGFARRAVKLRTKNAAYRIKYGDALYKLFRYKDAREQYQRALELGHVDASRLIKKVDAKLGG